MTARNPQTVHREQCHPVANGSVDKLLKSVPVCVSCIPWWRPPWPRLATLACPVNYILMFIIDTIQMMSTP